MNIVKPEPKRTSLNNTPSITESKYRLSNKLTAAAEIDTTTPPEPTDLQLEQKFAAAVQEEQKRKNQLSYSSIYHPDSTWSPGATTVPKLDTSPLPTSSSALSFPLSVDDWFAPDAQNPFTNFNLVSSSRQTSRFQSMFSDSTQPSDADNWSGIRGPLRLDTGLDEQVWKTD